jgi:hypothetical protein
MITTEQCEAIWPLDWHHSVDNELSSNSCRWLFRVALVPHATGVNGYINGTQWANGNLRDVLELLWRSLRERDSATDQTVPPILPVAAMIDRLGAFLCPKGWAYSSGALVFPGPLGQLVIRHEAGALDILPLGGGRVHTVALSANATDDEVKAALSLLLVFPRYP